MNLRSVDLNLLTVFDAIYQARHMSRAAERIGLSQPAMSLALGRLRHLLGDPLFVRARGAMQPTARAQQIAGPIRSILDTVASTLMPQPGFDYASSNRQFNLALGDYGAGVILPRLSEVLEEMGASIRLNVPSISTARLEQALGIGRADIALTFYPVTPPEFRCQLVYTDTLSVIARNNHPLMREGMTLEQYCALPHVIGAWPENRGLRPGELPLFEHAVRRKEFVLVDSFMHMPAVVAATDAIGTLPTRLAEHFARTHNLRLWTPPLGRGKAAMFLVWNRTADGDDGHAWMRSTLISLFERL